MDRKFFDVMLNPPEKWSPPETIPLSAIPDVAHPLWLVDLYTQAIPAEPGAAFLWMDDHFFHAFCVMMDSCPHSEAAPRDDKTWERGDTVELFFMPNSSETHYYEFHVTPNQAILELSIPDAEKLRRGDYPFEDLLFEAKTESISGAFANAAGSGWYGHIKVPRTLFEDSLSPDAPPKVAVCRYNYSRDPSKDPALSASCVFPLPRFHLPACWHTADQHCM